MGQDLNQLADSAKTLYDQGSYAQALEFYERVATAQVKDSELFHNMGNCYVRLGELGEAKVFFERALLFDPSNADAAYNLDWVNLRITDALVEPRQELTEWMSIVLRGIADSTTWAMMSWAVLGLAVVLLLLHRFSTVRSSWRIRLAISILGLSLLGAGMISTPKNTTAIVVSSSSYGYSEPTTQSTRIVLLAEGSAGKVLSTEGDWSYIELGDGRRGWFDSAAWMRVFPELELD